jgi:hypothetical protein
MECVVGRALAVSLERNIELIGATRCVVGFVRYLLLDTFLELELHAGAATAPDGAWRGLGAY